MGNIIPQTKDTPIPMGEHVATITDVALDDGKFGQQVKFTFELMADEHNGRQLLGWCGVRFSPKSKLYKWANAAIWPGQRIPENYNLDIDHFLNRQVILRVLIKEKDDGSEVNKVDSIAPLPTNDNPDNVIPAAPLATAAIPPQAQPAGSGPVAPTPPPAGAVPPTPF